MLYCQFAQAGPGVVQAECGELREKLQEAQKQQHSQEDMIRWLNTQVRHQPTSKRQRGRPRDLSGLKSPGCTVLFDTEGRQALRGAEGIDRGCTVPIFCGKVYTL